MSAESNFEDKTSQGQDKASATEAKAVSTSDVEASSAAKADSETKADGESKTEAVSQPDATVASEAVAGSKDEPKIEPEPKAGPKEVEPKKIELKAERSLPAPVPEGGGVGPFIAAANADTEAAKPRSFRAKLLDYSAHAAIIVGLIGFAWTLSAHVGTRPTAAQIETPTKVAAKAPEKPKVDEVAELRSANAQLASDIKALRSSLDSLRASVRPGQMRSMEASLESVRSGLNSAKSETNAEIAQLNGKLDKLQHEPQSKIQQLVDRLGKLEHQSVDTTATGSIGSNEGSSSKSVPTPPAKPTKLASAEDTHNSSGEDDKAETPVIQGWVVRDVYEGVALVQGRRGTLEVVPGTNIPGAGVVKSIDRHGNGWTVTTTKGQLAYAAPSRDYRRSGPRGGFYPGPGGYPPYAY